MGKQTKNIPQWVKDAKYKFCAVCGRTDDLQYCHWEPDNGHNTVPENIFVLCSKHHNEWHDVKRKSSLNKLIKDGIGKAKERGVKVGRKPANGEHIIRAIAERSTQFNPDSMTTEREIREQLGIKEVCYCKYKRKLIEAMKANVWPYEWEKPKQVRNRPEYEWVILKMRGA